MYLNDEMEPYWLHFRKKKIGADYINFFVQKKKFFLFIDNHQNIKFRHPHPLLKGTKTSNSVQN